MTCMYMITVHNLRFSLDNYLETYVIIAHGADYLWAYSIRNSTEKTTALLAL